MLLNWDELKRELFLFLELISNKVITRGGRFVMTFLNLRDTPDTYSSHGSKLVRVKSDETQLEFVSATEVDTYKVKIDSDDPTPGYLEAKIDAGANITITSDTDSIQINAAGAQNSIMTWFAF